MVGSGLASGTHQTVQNHWGVLSLTDELRVAIDSALTSQKAEPRYRVFRDGNLDYRACADVAKQWRQDAGKPQDQLREIAGSGSVLALNDVAAWNDGIRRHLLEDQRILPPAVSGGNIEATDVYAFISAGPGWTAFGAHVDFEHSIILDADGAGRDVLTWPEGAQYGQRMNEAKSFFGISFDWEKYAGESTRNRIKPGEVAVIRSRQPHIFHANGPGLFLGISTEGQNGTGAGSPISQLAAGKAWVPKHDSALVQAIMTSTVPPPISLSAKSGIHHSSTGIHFHGNSVALSAQEHRIVESQTIAGIVASYGTGSSPAVRALTAKLVMIGAAIVPTGS